GGEALGRPCVERRRGAKRLALAVKEPRALALLARLHCGSLAFAVRAQSDRESVLRCLRERRYVVVSPGGHAATSNWLSWHGTYISRPPMLTATMCQSAMSGPECGPM